MAPRHRRWLSRDALSSCPRHVFSFQVVSSAAISLSADRRKEWRCTPQTRENYHRENGLGPRHGGKKTLLGLLLSVRMKDRSYLQATPANGRWENEQGRKKEKEKRKRERKRERKRTPVKSPRGTRQRFASLYPWSKPFLFSPSRAERLCLFLPIHSRLLVDRFSFVIPFAAARENVPAKWERVSTRYNAQHVDNFQINFGKLFAFRQISRKRYFTLSLDFSFISRVPYSRTNNISVISDKQFLLSLSSRNNNSVDIRLKRIFPNIPASITN